MSSASIASSKTSCRRRTRSSPIPPSNAQRAERLARWRAERDVAAATLAALDMQNPASSICVEAHVTLGEISDRLRGVFGLYQPPALF